MLKRYTKYARTDPHPEVPFDDGESDELPTAGQAALCFILVFVLTVVGCYLV